MTNTKGRPGDQAGGSAEGRTCTMGTLPCSRQSTLSSTQCVTQFARSRISITSGNVGGATRSSTVFCVPRARASSSPAHSQRKI